MGKVGFLGLLGLLFIAAKLFGAIAWSWFWVLSPFWIGAILWVIVFLIALVAASGTRRY